MAEHEKRQCFKLRGPGQLSPENKRRVWEALKTQQPETAKDLSQIPFDEIEAIIGEDCEFYLLPEVKLKI